MSKVIKNTLETDFYNAYSGVYPIKWVNVNFDPTGLNLFLAPTFTPITTYEKHLGNMNNIEESMFFKINVVVQKGQGTGSIYNIVEDLKQRYSNTKIGSVIVDVPETLAIVEDGEWVSGGIRVKVRILSTF